MEEDFEKRTLPFSLLHSNTLSRELDLIIRSKDPNILIQLSNQIQQQENPFSKIPIPLSLYSQIPQMLQIFALRTLPPPKNPRGHEYDPSEDEEFHFAPCIWTPIEAAYKIFLTFLEADTLNALQASKSISHSWMHSLVARMASEDARERKMLTLILHRLYKLMPMHRRFLRGILYGVLVEFHQSSCSSGHYEGIAEILSIFNCLIGGFSLPMRQEHAFYFERAILPLFTSHFLPAFFGPLAACCSSWTKRQASPSTASFIVSFLIRNWPHAGKTSLRCLMFIEMLIDIFQASLSFRMNSLEDAQILLQMQNVIIQKIYRDCINDIQFQIAEKACTCMKIAGVHEWLEQAANEEIVAGTIGALKIAASQHWNQGVRSVAQSVLESYIELMES